MTRRLCASFACCLALALVVLVAALAPPAFGFPAIAGDETRLGSGASKTVVVGIERAAIPAPIFLWLLGTGLLLTGTLLRRGLTRRVAPAGR
jgi:hypothetical protein